MDIILYLLQIIQYLYKQNCWLVLFICKYIPLKQWAYFDITQVIGLTNDDAVSKEYRPFKQMIERLNRTYKQSYRPTNGFDNIDGANYDLALWVAYYNFLRPHTEFKYKPPIQDSSLAMAGNMPVKWQYLIAMGQRTIINIQRETSY